MGTMAIAAQAVTNILEYISGIFGIGVGIGLMTMVALCVFLVRTFQMGPQAVWYGMFLDWGVRSIIFTLRFLSGKWIHVEYRERKV